MPEIKPIKPPYRWYELDWVVPYRDFVLVVGYIVFEVGVFLIPGWGLPLGFITAGLGLALAACLLLKV